MDTREVPPELQKVASYLDKLEAKMPAELLEQARSMSEKELLRQTAMRAIEHLMEIHSLYTQARKRCGVCEQDRQCGHCFAEDQHCKALVQGAVALALMVKVATAAGTRCAAEREREDETAAKDEPKS